MIESGEGCDETFKDGVIMGIAHEALSIAAEYRRRVRELSWITAGYDQRSPFRPSLAANRQAAKPM
jgi:hypothetical protein